MSPIRCRSLPGAGASVFLVGCLLHPAPMFAVSPLTVDDADTVTPGQSQLNGVWELFRGGEERRLIWTLNPVFGVAPPMELGVTFGFQSLLPVDAAFGTHGVTDLTLASKLQLWQRGDERLRVSARLDLKLPTASRTRSLGTGQTDLGAVLLTSYRLHRTDWDANLGYTCAGLSRGHRADDEWFAGLAARHELTSRWTLLAEAFGWIPAGSSESAPAFHFHLGLQFRWRPDLGISLLVGSATGGCQPALTGVLGFTREM